MDGLDSASHHMFPMSLGFSPSGPLGSLIRTQELQTPMIPSSIGNPDLSHSPDLGMHSLSARLPGWQQTSISAASTRSIGHDRISVVSLSPEASQV